ncbi:unnamed protein product, partial [Rotaria sp. Silwood2]
AGIGGSHHAYRLSSTINKKICIFERNNYVGGRTYDRDYDGNSTEAYANTSISSQGAQRFYLGQAVIKQLADELNISYYSYDYRRSVIKARGLFHTSINQMCSTSYINLTCTDNSNGLNSVDQLWNKLMEEYHRNASNLYNFADFNAFCRSIHGDEATEFLRDSSRFRADFENVNAYAYMECIDQEWNLTGSLYYPHQGMSQLAKRMMYIATKVNQAQLYLNEEVLSIDDYSNGGSYVFSIETSRYRIRAKQLIAAIDSTGWKNIHGSIAHDIKSHENFQSIKPIKVVTIHCYWPNRWWEDSTLFGTDIDLAWTRQNCISFIEITSRRPHEKHQNLTRAVYDDGLCVETWSALIARPSQENLIQEILRGLRSIFIDVQIPRPTKVFTQIWSGAWHFQKSNSIVSNKQIIGWALHPLQRFTKNQFSLVGEVFHLDRSGWTEAAVKSSFISLTSQFDLKFKCYENDVPSGGRFCSSDFV